jgi:hypothetical protein
MIIAFVGYGVLLFLFEAIHTTVRGLAVFDNIFNLFPMLLFSALAIASHNRQSMIFLRMQSIP